MSTPIRDVSMSLFCPFADGVGAQSQTVPIADFDAEHHSVPGNWTVSVNSQPTLIQATVDATGLAKIKTIAPRGTVGSAVVKFSDGHTLSDGTPTPLFTVNIALATRPDASGPELGAAGLGPVVDEDPKIGA